MKFHKEIFSIKDFQGTKEKVLNWTKQFSTFCFLDNHHYHLAPQTMECLVAVGVRKFIKASAGHALEDLENFRKGEKCWLFGHLGYALKNEIEEMTHEHEDKTGFPDMYFFEPEVVVRLTENAMIIEGNEPGKVYSSIMESVLAQDEKKNSSLEIKNGFSRNEYIETIHELKKHILRGDCYEINFCQEFFAESASIDPIMVYKKLSDISPNPFSALYRVDDCWLICASPERFLNKSGSRIISQPIKGTSGRFNDDREADESSREELYNSSKDRSENVMIVDLVRNDLAKICREGSVQVDELFGVYSFPQVHQMISTISGELKEGILFSEIMQATFPMGSMTGAPKKKVMELIDRYEITGRGIFSGALGYITPEDDFDFNVVIRSIMYNATQRYVSIMAGSGITFYSDAEKEWEECLMKVAAMRKALE